MNLQPKRDIIVSGVGSGVLMWMGVIDWGAFKLVGALGAAVYIGYWYHREDLAERWGKEFGGEATFTEKDEVIEDIEAWASEKYGHRAPVNLATDDLVTRPLNWPGGHRERLHGIVLQTGAGGKEVIAFYLDSPKDKTSEVLDHRPLHLYGDKADVMEDPFLLSEYYRGYLERLKYSTQLARATDGRRSGADIKISPVSGSGGGDDDDSG